MKNLKATYKKFEIEISYIDREERCESDICKTINGNFYCGSIGAAEFEGLMDAEGETISCPQSVIDKAYDMEEQILKANGVW